MLTRARSSRSLVVFAVIAAALALGRQRGGAQRADAGELLTTIGDGFTMTSVGDLIVAYPASQNPDPAFRNLAKIVQETIAFWCEQFVVAGIPAEKLYPHVAAPAPAEAMNAPIWTAFNKHSRPGWTTYPVQVLGESFKPIYSELEKRRVKTLVEHCAFELADDLLSTRAQSILRGNSY